MKRSDCVTERFKTTRMRTTMKITTILLLLSIFSTSQVFAWTISADFENELATVDTIANSPNPDAFHGAAGRSRYAETPALSGNQSGSVLATKGETGFGVWGGGFTFPQALKEGDEIWFRVNVYYPAGWDFSCGGCSQGVKFMRIHTSSATGSNEGYHSTLIRSGTTTGGLIAVDSEVNREFYDSGKINADIFDLGTPIIRDQWTTYEMYIKFSSIFNQGIYRVWQDGNLIFEDLISATLFSSTSESKRIYLYTYWNNGAPKTQTSYVDDIVITSEVPGKKDADGNPYIGVGPSIYVAPPEPPTPVSSP